MHVIEIQSFLNWIAQHPHWALAVVFLIASAESLAVVGLIMPGAAVMVAAGALVTLGALQFWPTLFVAVTGAIVGDGISYWIGHHYRDRLRSVWPFHSHPEWLLRGENFFRRHGAKSVLFGRFVGPVRPIIPVVAGMLGMRPAVFYGVNVLSALAWAPTYLLPGMAFGASLALAGVVAARLAVLLVLLVASTWLLLWLVRWSFRMLSPQATQIALRVLTWAGNHPRLNRIFGGVLDPSRPEARALLLIGTLLIGSTWLFLGILEDVVTGDPLVRADQGLYQLMQGLRTPWGDKLMVFATELGDGMVIALVAAAVLAWLTWCRNWRAAKYWVAAIGFGQIAATALKLILQRPRPMIGDYGVFSSYAFPSGHATMSTVAYGFLAVLVGRALSPLYRWIPYALATLFVGAVALSRLYLGAHWLSDVLGGLSLGLAWVSLLAIAYYRHPAAAPAWRGLPYVALLALVLGGSWHVATRYSIDLQRYSPQFVIRHLDAVCWERDGWRSLPAYRNDLEGEFEQPLNVQWAGPLADLREELERRGWRQPVALNAASALRWLLPAAQLDEVPMLPQVHDGRHESLLMVRPSNRRGDAAALVLRLWQSGAAIDPAGVPLWVGTVSSLQFERVLFLEIPVTADEYDEALSTLAQSLEETDRRWVRRAPDAREYRWNGNVLLIRQSPLRTVGS